MSVAPEFIDAVAAYKKYYCRMRKNLPTCVKCEQFHGTLPSFMCSWCDVNSKNKIPDNVLFPIIWSETNIISCTYKPERCVCCLEEKILYHKFPCECNQSLCIDCIDNVKKCPYCNICQFIRVTPKQLTLYYEAHVNKHQGHVASNYLARLMNSVANSNREIIDGRFSIICLFCTNEDMVNCINLTSKLYTRPTFDIFNLFLVRLSTNSIDTCIKNIDPTKHDWTGGCFSARIGNGFSHGYKIYLRRRNKSIAMEHLPK